MNKKEIITQLEDLKYNCENYRDMETTKEDVQALEYAIKELSEEENTKCDCCLENEHALVVDNIKLCKECLEKIKRCSVC